MREWCEEDKNRKVFITHIISHFLTGITLVKHENMVCGATAPICGTTAPICGTTAPIGPTPQLCWGFYITHKHTHAPSRNSFTL